MRLIGNCVISYVKAAKIGIIGRKSGGSWVNSGHCLPLPLHSHCHTEFLSRQQQTITTLDFLRKFPFNSARTEIFKKFFFSVCTVFSPFGGFCFGNDELKERLSCQNPSSSVPAAGRMPSVFPEGFAEGSSRVFIGTKLLHISLVKRLCLEWTGLRFTRFVEGWNLILTLQCHQLIHGSTTTH